MTTVETGRRAEAAAAAFLQAKGCCILAQNWRTRACEIDVIAERGDTAFFCEVKYRRRPLWGAGLDYITPAKLKQMRFAAELWVYAHAWQGAYELCAVEVSGPHFRVTAAVKDL